MKTLFMSALVAASLTASVSFAAGNPQHEKMKTCNADAKTQNLKGQARMDFMKTCLSGKAPAAPTAAAPTAAPAVAANNAQMTPQERMKSCNAEAGTKQLKGADRKKFMSVCLTTHQ